MGISPKPTVFISSTVYDMQDLRSALKFWLEELGYEVMLSEYSDFPKDADKNSYEACLAAIARADYFILLIGNRVGGWFNEAQRVSITRMEYRKARSEFEQNGSPKPVVFVRQNLWDVREDRAALGHFLREFDGCRLSDMEKTSIAQHPSKFVDNADAIFSFLKEVGQVDAMKEATAGGGPLPHANWIHRFSTFREIIDALRVALNAKSSTEMRVLRSNLAMELAANLGHLLTKSKHGVQPVALWGEPAVDSIKGGAGSLSRMRGDFAVWLVIFRVMALGVPRRLSTLFARQAVISGAFMSHTPESSEFAPSALHTALLELLTVVDAIHSSPAPDTKDMVAFSNKMKAYRAAGGEEVEIPNMEIALACSDVKTFARVTELCRRSLRCLSGEENAFADMQHWSPSVMPDETIKIGDHTVTADEARVWALNS